VVRNDRESAHLRHPRVVRRDASQDRGDEPPAGVAPARREDLRVGELGGHLGEGPPQRREVQVGVGLGLCDVRGALQGQHLAASSAPSLTNDSTRSSVPDTIATWVGGVGARLATGSPTRTLAGCCNRLWITWCLR